MPAVEIAANESWMGSTEAPPPPPASSKGHGLIIHFLHQSVKDEEASKREGRPIHNEVEFIRKQIPGNKNDIVLRPVRPADLEEFATEYHAFKQRREMPLVGTPLSAWPIISRAQVDEMAYFGVRTVEQLAGLADNLCQQWMGVASLRQKARDFVEAARSNAPLERLRGEVEAKDERIANLEKRLSDMEAALTARAADKKK